jgi:hypothetical protein
MAEIAIQTAGGTRERYPLSRDRVTIGRSRESDIFLPDQWLSRHHAAIEERPDGYWVSDLKSKNGTLLNGEPVRGWHRLRPGDVITLGEHTLTFSSEAGARGGGGARARRAPASSRCASSARSTRARRSTRPSCSGQNRVLAILSKAASELVVHRPLGELFDLVLELLLEAVTAERGAILLLEGGVPQIKANRSRSGDWPDAHQPHDRAPGDRGARARCCCRTCSRTRASAARTRSSRPASAPRCARRSG